MKTTTNTWILVANRAHAKIFAADKKLALIRAIEHPEGKLKAGEINSDRSGLTFPRRGSGASSLDKRQDPTDREAERFAHQLAGMLHEERVRKAFDRLVLIAEPRFLAKLRELLPRPILAQVEQSFASDIAGFDLPDLRVEVSRLITA